MPLTRENHLGLAYPEDQNGSATALRVAHSLGSCGGGQREPKGGNWGRFKGLILIESGESSPNSARLAAMDLLSGCRYRPLSGERWFEIPIRDAFAKKFAEKVKGLKVGPGTEQGVVIGPLIDQQGIAKVESHVKDAAAKGGKVMLGGKRHALGGAVLRARGADRSERQHATRARGDLRAGGAAVPLQVRGRRGAHGQRERVRARAYFFSRDVGCVFRVAEALEAGIISVNTGIFSQEVAPFGGVKQSGIGREGSKYGIEPFLEVKFICLGGI